MVPVGFAPIVGCDLGSNKPSWPRVWISKPCCPTRISLMSPHPAQRKAGAATLRLDSLRTVAGQHWTAVMQGDAGRT